MNHNALENSLVAVGDIMLGDSAICVGFGFRSRYPHDIRPAFAGVSSLLRRGQVVLGNLECPLTRVGRGQTRFRADQMRGDPEYAQGLRALGFTALGVANNHAMQHGIEAFEETINCLRSAGIACVGLRGRDGWCADPVVHTTTDGFRIGLLGYSWRPRQYDDSTPPYAEGDAKAVEEDVRRLRGSADAVVVSLHWGEEFLSSPSVSEVDAARRIIDAGAAVIVGHHPHVLRPVERHNAGLICYSLGNFATDMLWEPALRSGAVLQCGLNSKGVREPKLSRTGVDDSYATTVDVGDQPLHEGPVSGILEPEYRIAAALSVRRQRRAAYAYALRNIRRYPPKVLAELVGTTLRNKLRGLLRRSRTLNTGSIATEAEASISADSFAGTRSGRGAPLSILHVLAPAHFGGLESVVRELAVGQARRGHTVRVAVVLSPGDQPHPFVAALESAGLTVIKLQIGDRDYRGERRAVRAICRQHRPSVMHTHGYRADVVDGVVARSEGVFTVSTCHGFIESAWRGRPQQWLQRRALRRFGAVVAVSRSIEQRLLAAGVSPAKIRLIPNAVALAVTTISREEARRLLQLPSAPLIGWVGRLSAEKGPDLALEAFARLDYPSAHLVILGSGRDAPDLQARAAALGISERIIWRGAVPNAGTLFRAFDAFLLSSRTEGTPMAILEAMAAEVPIVATRVGGIPELLDSLSAHLVDSGDVESMAACIAEVLRNPTGSRARTERARKQLAERFAVEPWLSAYESIYSAALSSG